MNDLCNCPNTDPLESIPEDNCPFNLEQIQKIIVQEVGYKFDSGATPATDPTLKADWDTLFAASDDTKAVITPFARNVVIEAGDFITTGGGDNSTLNGVEEIEGLNPAPVTGMFKSVSPAIEKALKKIACKKVQVFFVNGAGKIIAKDVGSDKTTGFVAESFGVKDRRNQGFGTKDQLDFQFSLKPGWSEDLVIIDPQDFNPLYDL